MVIECKGQPTSYCFIHKFSTTLICQARSRDMPYLIKRTPPRFYQLHSRKSSSSQPYKVVTSSTSNIPHVFFPSASSASCEPDSKSTVTLTEFLCGGADLRVGAQETGIEGAEWTAEADVDVVRVVLQSCIGYCIHEHRSTIHDPVRVELRLWQ